MLLEGKNCWRRVHADRAAFLIDGEAYFDTFARAALRARRSILIVGWDFNSRTRLWYGEPPPGVPSVLGDFLDFLVKHKHGLQIHVLDWDFPMIYAIDREAPPTFGLGWKPRHRIHLRFDRNFPTGGSQHQKVIVLRRADRFGRLHVYYPVVPDLGDRSINMHAKLCITDDEFARVGSANLNNRSMGFDTECDITVEADGSDVVRCAIAGFRAHAGALARVASDHYPLKAIISLDGVH